MNKQTILLSLSIVITTVLLLYYLLATKDIADLRFDLRTIESDLELIHEDYETKTSGYKFVNDKLIAEYSDLVQNDSLRNFLLSHRGLSETFHWYEIKIESLIANVNSELDVLISRQNVTLLLALFSIATNVLSFYKMRKVQR